MECANPQVSNEHSNSRNRRVRATRLCPDFTFDRYVTGRTNRVATASAEALAKSIDTKFRLLYVHGEVGVGKTHLLQAIGNAFLSCKPGARIRFIHSHEFFMDVVDAFQRKSFDDFRRYFRSLDLLIIDDIEFLKAKERTQEELYHIINALANADKTVVISSSQCPRDLVQIDEQLVSRFEGGTVVAIEPPNRRLRKSILAKLSAQNGLVLSTDVVHFVARRFRSNVRQLEGALHSLVAHARCRCQPIDLALAKAVLTDSR